MRITTRRRGKLIGGALFAASLAAGSFATAPVSADIGDTPGVFGYIRVQPTNGAANWESQPAPTVMAGTTNTAAANVQLLIPNEWESGDKITLQVQADNNASPNGHQTNCLSAAQSISFAGPYSAADVAVGGAWVYGSGWGYDLDPDWWPGTDDGRADPRTPGAASSLPAPTFNVALTTSPSCGGVGVTDQIELTFSNSAVTPNSDYFQLTFSNIRYNIGAGVPAGPVHVIPFARSAVDAAPGTFADELLFGGNAYSTATGLLWTNNAFISPVTITTTTAGTIVADETLQPLGSITLTELVGDALNSGTHRVALSGVDNLAGPLTVAVTGNGTATGTATIVGTAIDVTLSGMTSGAGTVTISGLLGEANTAGMIVATLVSDAFVNEGLIQMTASCSAPGQMAIFLVEVLPDSLSNGTYRLNVGFDLVGPHVPLVLVAGNGGTAAGTVVVNDAGDYLDLTLTNMDNNQAGTVYIDGLMGPGCGGPGPIPVSGGSVSATAPTGQWEYYMMPDDQDRDLNYGSDSDWSNDFLYSDVDAPADPSSVMAMAVGLPDRIGGNDRYETSSKIAANLTICTDVAVIVSGTSYADALSANYLAGALAARSMGDYDVPVLSVTGDTLPYTTAQYLSWAGVGHVYIVGGTAAVSAGIEAQLAATLATDCAYAVNWVNNQKIQVTRVSGADRYATNRAAANLGSDIWGWNNNWNRNRVQLELLGPGKRTAIVATGTGFADALAAGPIAYGGLPLILTDGASLSASALGTLQDLDIEQVIIIGGTAAVSDAVRAQITGMGILTGRVAGANRYATAAAWATFVEADYSCAATAGEFDCGLGWGYGKDGIVFLASGTNFADALSGGPLAWDWDGPIVLTNPAALSPETAAWLTANAADLDELVVLGLGQAVSTAAMNAASAAISVA